MSVHETAQTGFSSSVTEYEKGRPDYPTLALDYLIDSLKLGPESRVLDVGAGTGKLTRMLINRKLHVMALEPVRNMRLQLTKNLGALLPSDRILDGRAESLPMGSATLDLITVAQAFHWFDGPKALSEFSRVLKPGGHLVLIWNSRDESLPWVKQLTEILKPYEGQTPRYRTGAWKQAFVGRTDYDHFEMCAFSHEQVGDAQMLVNRVGSISFVAALPEDKRNQVAAQIQKLAETHPDLKGQSEIRLPYSTEMYIFRRSL